MPIVAITDIFGISGRRAELPELLARPSGMSVHSVSDSLRPVPGGMSDPRDVD